jgi:hypothetical protein
MASLAFGAEGRRFGGTNPPPRPVETIDHSIDFEYFGHVSAFFRYTAQSSLNWAAARESCMARQEKIRPLNARAQKVI